MKTDERFLNSKMFQQHSGVSGVLRRHYVGRFQNFNRAQSNVAEVSDRRRDDVKHPRSSDEIWFCAIGSTPQLLVCHFFFFPPSREPRNTIFPRVRLSSGKNRRIAHLSAPSL